MSASLLQRFLAGMLATGLGSLSVVVLGMLGLMVSTRILPAAELGAFFLLQTLVIFLAEGSSFGIHLALARFLSGIDAPDQQRRITSTAFLFLAPAVAFTASSLWLCAAPLMSLLEVTLTAKLLALLVSWFVFEAFLKLTLSHHQARFAFRAIGITNALSSLVNLLVILTLVLGSGEGLAALLAAKLLSRVAALGYAGLACRPRLGLEFDAKLLRRMLRYSLPLYANYFLSFLSQRADTLLIGSLLGTTAVAFYEVARRIPESLMQFHESFLQVYFTFVARHALQQDKCRVSEFLHNSTRFGSLLLGLGCVITFGFGREIVVLMFSDTYLESALPFALLMAASSLLMIEATFGSTLAAVGDSTRPLLINSVRTGLLMIAYLVLIPNFELVGAAAAALTATAAVIPVNVYFLRRRGIVVDKGAVGKPILITALLSGLLITASTAPAVVRAGLVISYLPAALLWSIVTRAEIAAARGWLSRHLHCQPEVANIAADTTSDGSQR
ncbi:lipopolysaccharide biosynthesis protein [Halochromatium roseum]|uniref:lipopolysaccharide biosynthesis protein n=1 Tax=Halochromatium roseum TaxID=391920 RepID=UPI001912505E|nr:oligosaccharide flippase family protein [Halochromatium roseum]MBK5940716.1 hypothetical protein [Halochromatium roseum]